MPREHDEKTFLSFGEDVKSARLAMGISRRELAEMVDIDPRLSPPNTLRKCKAGKP